MSTRFHNDSSNDESRSKKVIDALEDSRFNWRTIGAVARETGLAPEEVLATIRSLGGQVITSAIPDREGRPLYTTKNHYDRRRNALKRPEIPPTNVLTVEQRRNLHDALLAAFPSSTDLQLMTFFHFDENLARIAADTDLRAVVMNLIQFAIARGRVEELLKAARAANPTNSELLALEQELAN